MVWFCLGLAGPAFVIAGVGCALMLRLSARRGLYDFSGAEAHKKHDGPVPNTGGVGIVWAVALPMAALLALAWLLEPAHPGDAEVVAGVRAVTRGALVLIVALLALHVVGVIDDRRPLPAGAKLIVQTIAALAVVLFADTRVLEMLDEALPGGYAMSVVLSVLWIVIITNAFNMLDNMDGLSAGVGAIAAAIFLAAALLAGQWFVAGAAALLLGALLAFLCFNFPPATLFMGDGGSLVLGFLMSVIAVQTTYAPEGVAGRAHALLTPLVVLAVPLYDLVSVVWIRLRQGKRPWVGDTQHFSHRLVMLGLSRRRAVGVIYLATAATGLGGVTMARAEPWQAVLIAGASASVLAMIGLLEHGALRAAR